MTDALLGRQLANYRIEYLLGQGGMANVYFGTDVRLNRPVAIKVLDERLRANQAYARRFVREAQTVAAWRHENVLQVYYADISGGVYYFVTEFIDGADLGKLLDEYTTRNELIPHADVLRIGYAIASALDFAHRQGVIHRDVKPANVLVASDGRVVLGDFGLALELQGGTLGEVLGTPQYISPEQARNSAGAVPASDLYSLGVILYEMLTGAVPFDDPSPTTVALQHVTLLPPLPREINPDLNAETEQVLLKALSKNPQDRYQSGKELLQALEQALALPDDPTTRTAAPENHFGEHARLSNLTVLDLIAARTPQTAELLPQRSLQSAPSVEVGQAEPGIWRARLVWIGVVLLIVILAVVLASLQNSSNPPRSDIERPRTTGAVFPATQTGVELTPVVTQPIPDAVISPSLIPLTETSQPAELEPTSTSLPAETLAAPVENTSVEPTVKYPQGRHLRFLYNDTGFYIYSLADERINIEPIAFERVESLDEFTNRFEGFEWAKLYAYIWPKNCLKAEIRDSRSYLSPSVCLGYNAMRTFKRNEDVVFWTSRQGTSQFRVLWYEEEIARCEIADGVCEVFLP